MRTERRVRIAPALAAIGLLAACASQQARDARPERDEPQAAPAATLSPMQLARLQRLWDRGAFAAEPSELLQAGASATGTASPVAVLFEETRHVFEADGRSAHTYRTALKILTQEGVEEWDAVGSGWSPWYEQKPKLRARVIAPDGRVFELDPATIEHGSGSRGNSDLYSDRQYLRAPLPGIAVGAVVEYEISIAETAPMFAAGVTFSFRFGGTIPVHAARLVVEAPASAPVQFSRRGAGAPLPVVERRGGRTTTTFAGGPYEAIAEIPSNLPYSVPRVSSVGYTTGRSWAEVAKAYRSITEPRIDAAGFRKLVAGIRPKRDRDERIRKLVALLHEKLRYTGIEFGESSIVPNDPAEVLARGFGDCKDKSVVLLSMLRAAGIDARIALLRAGFDADVDPKLPGLGRLNHAIVFVPGSPALWIDATARYTAVGDLPLSVQGRQALVVAPDTTELITIPRRPPKANRVVESRTFKLHETEPTRVKEITTSFGAEAVGYRSWHHGADSKKAREQLADYVDKQYGSGKLVDFEHSDALAVDEPFVMTIDAEGGNLASIWDDGAEVSLRLTNIFEFLPHDLKTAPEQGEKPRKEDYVLYRPYTYVMETRIELPAGYSADRKPEKKTWKLGPARLTQETVETENAVVVRHSFDSGPLVLTPAEHLAYRRGLQEWFESDMEVVTFRQDGEAHLESGRVREALKEFRRLVDSDPDNPRPHGRWARALLAAGLGDAARRAMQAAVKRFPNDADLHRVRGWVLEHDLVGKRFGRGFDFDGALEAYRRAQKIAPDSAVVLASIGILLERDASGAQSFPVGQLKDAAKAYKALFDQENRYTDVNYLLVLLKDRRFDDVIAVAKKLPAEPTKTGIMLAAVAAKDGLETAMRELERAGLDDDGRAEALRLAGAEVMRLRRYSLAALIFEEAAKTHENAVGIRMFAQQMRNLARNKPEAPSNRKPASAAIGLLQSSFEIMNEGRADRFLDFAAPPLWDWLRTESKGDNEQREAVREAMLRYVQQRSEGSGVPFEVVKDLMTLVEPKTEGDDGLGYRVVLNLGERMVPFYVVRFKRRYGVAASYGRYKFMGQVAHGHLKANRLAAARKWLDWAAQDSGRPGGDPIDGLPILKVWTPGFPGSKESIRASIGTLLAYGLKPDDRAEPLLRECIAKPSGEVAKLGCEVALHGYFVAQKRFKEAVALSAQWLESFPDSELALTHHIRGLSELKDLKTANKVLSARDRRKPNDPFVLRLQADVALEEEKFDRAMKLLQRVTRTDSGVERDFNNLAWYTWSRGGSLDKAEQLARKAVEKSRRSSYSSLHTLATVLADRGKPEEALAVLHEAMSWSDESKPSNGDWQVIGMIAEAYGLESEAMAAYDRVTAPKEEAPPHSVWDVSQKRVKGLEKRMERRGSKRRRRSKK